MKRAAIAVLVTHPHHLGTVVAHRQWQAQRPVGHAVGFLSQDSGLCGWLQRTGAAVHDPWRDVDIRIHQPERMPHSSRHQSVKRLLASLCRSAEASRATIPVGLFKRPYEANTLVAVALILGTGLCDGEVATLRCDDLDPDARSARVIGKGSRERQADLSSGPVRRSPTRLSRYSRHARIGSSTR